LDIVQMPRMPEDLKAYLEAFAPRGTVESAPLIARHWLLTNTRYLLGPAGYSEVMNQQLDPAQHRFRILQRFEVLPKPGILQPSRLEELTAVPNENGRYALFEFTGALPRVKLYANWQVNTNDQDNLKTLADLNFDPAKTVLVSTPQKNLPASATNENTGTVEFKSYASKRLVFAASAAAPSVLLLNDKYDSHWRVTVDGKPAELLRCNYLMRGVYLQPGAHTVEFDFRTPNKPLYVTLAGIGAGILLCGFLLYSGRRNSAPAVQP
ncbi:MAG TPA: YfhO family protein, partial [Verrucomicrobiae bacterium]